MEFLAKVANLAFVNPFSQEREKADCELLGIKQNCWDIFQRLEKIQTRLTEQFAVIQPIRLQDYSGEKLEIIKLAWLFYQYHLFQENFNQSIEDQIKAGDSPIKLEFTRKLIKNFAQCGFTEQETDKFIALFFQLQRGFYFINSALVGQCQAMVDLRMRLWNNIFSFNPRWYLDHLCGRMEDFSTLILGGTGTGKSLTAQTIGRSAFIPFKRNSLQFKESFTRCYQSINLSQFAGSLMESELFGHKKGAFTGAIDNHQGIFSRCSEYGAVFIDEIGDVDIPTQVKLLNVIQDRVFSPVGSRELQRFSGRLISATNRDIEVLRKDQLFRDDLFYRLCSDVISVPSLKQRLGENPDELRLLIIELIGRVVQQPVPEFVQFIESKLYQSVGKNYCWPGNVRELEQAIRRIILTGEYPRQINQSESNQMIHVYDSESKPVSAQQLMHHYCHHLYDKHHTYEAVARITGLDRRTVKKYLQALSTD